MHSVSATQGQMRPGNGGGWITDRPTMREMSQGDEGVRVSRETRLGTVPQARYVDILECAVPGL